MNQGQDRKFVELTWECPNCNTRNRGSNKSCESCGAAQPENVQFQRAADEHIVTDAAAVQAAKAGADIHCGFCGTRNPGNAVTCLQCGGDLKEGKARQAGQILQAAPTAPSVIVCVSCGAENSGTAQKCKQCGASLGQGAESGKQQTMEAPQGQSKNKNRMMILAGIAASIVVACLALVYFFVLPSKTVVGTVTNLQWQTSVPVEEIQAVNYNNEKGSPPSDAYNVSCHDESRQVCEEKTIDQGNGFAEVVQDCHLESEKYCSYTLDEWVVIETYTSSGEGNQPIYENPSLSNAQRLGNADETLTVFFDSQDGQKSYEPGSVSEFQQFEAGSSWNLIMNAAGGILRVEPK